MNPIKKLKQLQATLDNDYGSFVNKQIDLADFLEYDLEKLIEALEQQENDHAEQIANLKEELGGYEQLELNYEHEGAN